jgi:hypothetical protein
MKPRKGELEEFLVEPSAADGREWGCSPNDTDNYHFFVWVFANADLAEQPQEENPNLYFFTIG